MKRLILPILAFCFLTFENQAQTTISIAADRDNTLYESSTGALSNGVGAFLFAGRTQNNGVRRALIHFDLSAIPANAVIDTVVLAININKVNGAAGTDNLNVHRLSADWGEGTSNAPSNEGGGTSATTGDATWLHRFFPGSATTNWTSVGGDYVSTASATISTSGLGTEFFGSTQLTADVNNWLTNPTQNFGWIIIGNEAPGISARRFDSKDGAVGGPSLRVTYLTTGITEAANSKKIALYPIPAEDFLVIEHRKNVFNNRVRVYDTQGKLVLEDVLGMDNRLSVDQLKSGIYILELTTQEGNDRVNQKFVKN